ncbi:MAG: CBS domain-containing protein [Opitutaceae bacterium]|nr:CBS domain-containing protein [Opitutaceae bacterium]
MKIPISALLAQKDPVIRWVAPGATVQDAVAAMAAHRIGCIVIIDDDHLAGLFTENDLLVRVVAAGLDPRTTPITRVMSPRPITVEPSLTLDKTMALISEKRVRHLPVVEGGRLVGLVSIGDLNKWIVERLQSEADALRSYVTGQYPG